VEIYGMKNIRIETDGLGRAELPVDALYGINTLRSLHNFPFSGRSIASHPHFIWALATVKQAAARANSEIGAITVERADAIFAACNELKSGGHHDHLVVDILEGSGGTSTNMNINEVIANIAALRAGLPLGEYAFVHPNDHVNLGQSTNDVIPTGMKLAIFRSLEQAPAALERLADAFCRKKKEYGRLLRLGRTCLQDAQPMTLGQAFGGYETVIRRHARLLDELRQQFLHIPLGGTAIGTGFGSHPGYHAAVYRQLSELVGVIVHPSSNSFDGMQNMDVCARLSAELRNTANTLWKIASDLVMLSSGPNGGIEELTLPSVQAGSSIMPGKVNPVIPMAVCQIAIAISGNDTAVAMACQQGMLEINHYELLVCDRLLESIAVLSRSAGVFADRCIDGLLANEAVSYQHLLASSALATALTPELGYAKVSSVVHSGLEQRRAFVDVAIEQGLLKQEEIAPLLLRTALGHRQESAD
jgi:aspartate ammonia-lyase